MFAVKSSHSTAALWVVSSLALASNVAVFGYHIYRVVKFKLNPFKDELYTNLEAYKQVAFDYRSKDEVSFVLDDFTKYAFNK